MSALKKMKDICVFGACVLIPAGIWGAANTMPHQPSFAGVCALIGIVGGTFALGGAIAFAFLNWLFAPDDVRSPYHHHHYDDEGESA